MFVLSAYQRLKGWFTNIHVIVILTVISIMWFLFISIMTIFRYRANYSSTFDFGIFSQMFYYMDKTFQPLTTCERDGLLSHFAVHISPIFYVLLPFYKLVPKPEMLLVIQAAVVITGIIPLYRIARLHGLSNLALLCICLIYCFYPALMGGCFYDFHENVCLTAIILWLLYAADRKKYPMIFLFWILLLMVKEDAAVYAACIGLFLFFDHKEYKYGGIIVLGSCLYFFAAIQVLTHFGDGAMINRYDNLISDPNMGFFSVVKTILVNPIYVFLQLFTKEKIVFMLQMLVPMGFLPLMIKRWTSLILFIPFVLINLLSDYPYQHSVYFQYTYGSAALLFYLVIIHYKNISLKYKGSLLLFCVIASILFTNGIIGQKPNYVQIYKENKAQIEKADQLFGKIPKEASVTATTFFVPKLSLREEVYMLDDIQRNTDYIVLNPMKLEEMSYCLDALELGYRIVGGVEKYLLILKKDRNIR